MKASRQNTAVEGLLGSLRPLRQRLVEHEIYSRIQTLDDLQVFMSHHVFAVWDFMSLLKALQRHCTCVTLPWVPEGNPVSRRLINEIVLGEESDEHSEGGYTSHFELYLAAMEQCGADKSRVEDFLACIRRGEGVHEALEAARVPGPARAFVNTTWRIIESGRPHSIAAAFAFGREELIPDMFRRLIADLRRRFPSQVDLYYNYLERHIHLDEETHTPMALRMLTALCEDDEGKWKEATYTARLALNTRITLWDGVAEAISVAKGRADSSTTKSRCASSGSSIRTSQ